MPVRADQGSSHRHNRDQHGRVRDVGINGDAYRAALAE